MSLKVQANRGSVKDKPNDSATSTPVVIPRQSTRNEDQTDSQRHHRPSTTASVFYDMKKRRDPFYVSSSFKRKTCTQYIPQSASNPSCCCGRQKQYHHGNTSNYVSGSTWDPGEHIQHRPTNAYGELEFQGVGNRTRAKFVRLADDSDPRSVLRLLCREWKLEYPKLLISVTGGAKNFRLPPKLKQLFRQGLLKVAQSTGAWVTTGGTNTGVMKHVGEALQGAQRSQLFGPHRRRRVYCIGIATWGIVNHKHTMTNKKEPVPYHVTSSIGSQGACLDHNHTHFLLVDNGTANKYGAEISLRAKLEKSILEMRIDKNRSGGGVPAVLLLLEGGPNSVKTVYEAVTNDPAIPVVVIQDSGRAADLLAYAHTLAHGEGPLYDMNDVVQHTQLLQRVETVFPELSYEKSLEVYYNILKCVGKKEYITIFKMEEGGADIDQAMLTALLKCQNTSVYEQLNLALCWDRADIARNQIFIEEQNWNYNDLEMAMRTALSTDKVDFVELLLENGVSMESYISITRLEDLYNMRASQGANFIKMMVGSEKARMGTISLRDIGIILHNLTGGVLGGMNEGGSLKKFIFSSQKLMAQASNPQAMFFPYAFNELFIWAILNNMQSMALCMWKNGQEMLAKALVGSWLYKTMARAGELSKLQDDLVDEFRQNSDEFMKLSVQLLDECFRSNERYAEYLLTNELENWGKQTVLSLAVQTGHEVFVAHPCCQALLSEMWYGALKFNAHQSLKTVAALCFFPGVLALQFRSKQELKQMPMTEEDPNAVDTEDEFDDDDDKYVILNNENGAVTETESKGLVTGTEKNSNEEKGIEMSPLKDTLSGNVSFAQSFVSLVNDESKEVFTISSGESQSRAVSSELEWYNKYVEFYRAPIAKFWANVIIYLLFLGLYSSVVLVKLPKWPSIQEWVLIGFVVSLTSEEIRQLLTAEGTSFDKKIKQWSSSKWNVCDALAIILFYVAVGFRFSEAHLAVANLIYAIDIMLWIVRLLDIFSVNKHLGPYVVMIGHMTLDLAYFIFILIVFVIAYGVARHAILEPNAVASWDLFGKVFFVPYFQIYGELFMERVPANPKETIFGTAVQTVYGQTFVIIIMSFFLVVANILLLNLLIAIFNNTFSTIQANSNQIWKFQRYHLIMEYANRPTFIPPFVFLAHLALLFKFIYYKCFCCQQRRSFTEKKLKRFLDKHEEVQLFLFEEECVANLLRQLDSMLLATQEEKVKAISERTDNMNAQLSDFIKDSFLRERFTKENFKTICDKMSRLESSLNLTLEMFQETKTMLEAANLTPRLNALRDSSDENPDSDNAMNVADYLPVVSRKRMKRHSESSINVQPLLSKRIGAAKGTTEYRRSSLLAGQMRKRTTSGDAKKPNAGPAAQRQGSLKRLLPRQKSFDPSYRTDEVDGDLKRNRVSSLSRSPLYPLSECSRFSVPDKFTKWEADYQEYDPPSYTSQTILAHPAWADPEDTESIVPYFNQNNGPINRQSHLGEYKVLCGIPRNPIGRTGIKGRGHLARWGCNHAADVIISRWKRTGSGVRFMREDKDVLEFLAIPRKGTADWMIPGGMLEGNDFLPKTLRQQLTHASAMLPSHMKDTIESDLGKILNSGLQIHRGYVDDARNTDNAWIETIVMNYHDEIGDVISHFCPSGISLTNQLQWQELSSHTSLHPNHIQYMKATTKLRNAFF